MWRTFILGFYAMVSLSSPPRRSTTICTYVDVDMFYVHNIENSQKMYSIDQIEHYARGDEFKILFKRKNKIRPVSFRIIF